MSSQLFKFLVLTFSIACFLPSIVRGQVVYEGQIVDKNTELPIQGVTVRLLKQGIGAVTTNQGYFNLVSDQAVANDTLLFSSVGYHPFRLPVSAYKENLFLLLHTSITTLDEVGISDRKLKDAVLNRFDWADIADDRLITTFSTKYAFAKLFTAPNTNVFLKSVAFGRKRREHSPLKTSMDARFLLRVMRVNPITGGPGQVLFTKQVLLSDNAKLVRVDLTEDNMIIPDSKFYISIEWLRVPFNEVIGLSQAPKVRKVSKKRGNILEDASNYIVSYQPVLLAMYRKKTAISWVKVDKERWTTYNSEKHGNGIEIALSATIRN